MTDDDYKERIRKKAEEILSGKPNGDDCIFGKSSGTYFDPSEMYQRLVSLRESLVRTTGDEKFVDNLVSKFDNAHIFEGFIVDLVRRRRASFSNVDPEEIMEKAERLWERYHPLSSDYSNSPEARYAKQEFERGMKLAEQSEI